MSSRTVAVPEQPGVHGYDVGRRSSETLKDPIPFRSIRAVVRLVLCAAFALPASFLVQAAFTSSTGHPNQSHRRIKVEAVRPVPRLYPGAVTNLRVRIKNLTTHKVRVRAIAPNGPVSSTDPECSDARDDPDTRTGVVMVRRTFAEPKVVAAASEITVLLRDALMMNNRAVQSCQGVMFRIPLTAVATA